MKFNYLLLTFTIFFINSPNLFCAEIKARYENELSNDEIELDEKSDRPLPVQEGQPIYLEPGQEGQPDLPPVQEGQPDLQSKQVDKIKEKLRDYKDIKNYIPKLKQLLFFEYINTLKTLGIDYNPFLGIDGDPFSRVDETTIHSGNQHLYKWTKEDYQRKLEFLESEFLKNLIKQEIERRKKEKSNKRSNCIIS